MFGSWLRGYRRDLKPLLLLGAAATCWLPWLCRNDLVFEKKTYLFSLACDTFGYSLALHQKFSACFDCGGIATLDASGDIVFLPSTWMVI
jgi:hypothetical protein